MQNGEEPEVATDLGEFNILKLRLVFSGYCAMPRSRSSAGVLSGIGREVTGLMQAVRNSLARNLRMLALLRNASMAHQN